MAVADCAKAQSGRSSAGHFGFVLKDPPMPNRNVSLLNRAALRRRALELAAEHRPSWGATRVSRRFLDQLEADLRAMLLARIQRAPSRGETL